MLGFRLEVDNKNNNFFKCFYNFNKKYYNLLKLEFTGDLRILKSFLILNFCLLKTKTSIRA